jgi:hypothetical protein
VCIADMIEHIYIGAGYWCVHYRHDRTQTLVQDTGVCITNMIGHKDISAGYWCVHYRHDRTQRH